MRGMVLAAGLGTRLGELGSEHPKPLLPVANVPLIRYSLALLRAHSVSDIIVNLHHLGSQIEQELKNEVAYSWERDQILGTGGGIKRAAAFFQEDPFFVLNGKIVIDLDLDLLAAHHRRSGALATLVVRADPKAKEWGAVDVDEASGRVRAIRGSEGRYMFTGVHLIETELLGLLPEGPSDIVQHAYLPALARGARIGAYRLDGYFWEHSTAERYLAGNLNLLQGVGARLEHAPGPLRGIDATARIDPKARIMEPVLIGREAHVGPDATVGPQVVLGPNAAIEAGVAVEHAVIWPGAVARSNVNKAVVTPTRVYPIGL